MTSLPTFAVPTAPAGGTAPAPPFATQPAEVDVCALISLGDVQASSPFSTPMVTAEGDVPSVCLYSNWHVTSKPTPDPVSVTLRVTTFSSHADAMTVFQTSLQDATNLNITPQLIAGLGDTAAAFPGGDEVSVHAVLGSRLVEIRLKGQFPDVGDAEKVPAATSIVRLTLSRLP